MYVEVAAEIIFKDVYLHHHVSVEVSSKALMSKAHHVFVSNIPGVITWNLNFSFKVPPAFGRLQMCLFA